MWRWSLLGALAFHLPLTSAAPIAIANTQALAFGKFAAGTGGSVLVSSGGARSAAGGVVLLSSGSLASARFAVSGDAGFIYAISLPADGAASLSNTNGQSMLLSHFTSSPATGGLLDATGRQTLSVGARLNVSASQPGGNYSGSFLIYVDYN